MAWKAGLAAAIAVISCPIRAAEVSPATAALARVVIDQSDLKAETGRKSLALAVGRYCNDVKQAYPQNSPEEDRWLDGEAQGDEERIKRALSSPEMGRRQAKLFTDSCALLSSALEREPDRSRHFVALAYTFFVFTTDAEFFARKNRVDPERLGFDTVLRFTTESLLLAALSTEK
jgi:hypothetical protein